MPPPLFRAYVDESGDRGMSPKSSPYFILAAVIVRDSNDAHLRAFRDDLCSGLGKPISTVLHWSENIKAHDARKWVVSQLRNEEICRYVFVVADKSQLRNSGLNHERLYNYALRRLLERVSWCVGGRNGVVKVKLAHVRRFPYTQLNAYLQHLQTVSTEIRWEVISGTPQVESQSTRVLLQIADIAAGCMASAIVPDRFDQLEPTYLMELRPWIYTRPPGAITSYGVNIVGNPGNFTQKFPWWGDFEPEPTQ